MRQGAHQRGDGVEGDGQVRVGLRGRSGLRGRLLFLLVRDVKVGRERVPSDGAVSPATLGGVERLVRLVEQRLRIRRLQLDCADPQAGGDVNPAGGGLGLDPVAEPFGRLRGALEVHLGQQDAEFFAAVAADDVRLPCQVLEQLGDVPQHLVADAMPVPVVDPLEVVDVDHDAGERVVVALRAAPLGFERGEEAAAVHAAGQRVGRRQRLELLVLPVDLVARLLEHLEHLAEAGGFFLDGGDVVEGRQRPADPAVAAEDRGAVDAEGPRRLRLVLQAQPHARLRRAVAQRNRPRIIRHRLIRLRLRPL